MREKVVVEIVNSWSMEAVGAVVKKAKTTLAEMAIAKVMKKCEMISLLEYTVDFERCSIVDWED